MTFRLFLQRGVLSAQTAGFTPLSTDYNAPPEILDLMDAGSAYVLKSSPVHDYTPGIAGLKSNAPIIESSVSSGRQYQATPLDAVTDTIVLIPNAGATAAGRAAFLSQIAQFTHYANEFQSSQAQVQPVFIGRQLLGDAGLCYSLIYDIQFAPSGDWLDATTDQSITLSVVHYYAWTPIPMGSNPKFYTFERRGLIPGTDYDFGDLVLNDWQNATANHRNWLEQEVYNIYTTEPTPDRLNFIDIPAENIPGDLPALCCIVADRDNSTGFRGFAVARYTKALNATLSTTLYAETATLTSPAGVATTFVVDATRGISSTPGANPLNDYVIQVAVGAGATSGGVVSTWPINLLNFSGRYDIVVRCATTTGVATDLSFYVDVISPISGAASFLVRTDGTFNAPTGASDTGAPTVGRLDLTQQSYIPRAFDTGESGFSDETYSLRLQVMARTGGAACTVRITDVLLIPIDECAAYMPFGTLSRSGGLSRFTILDNTGYFSANKTDGASVLYDESTTPDNYIPIEMRGQFITLLPGRDNRLYFYIYLPDATPVNDASNNATMRIRINVIPQWRHGRAVL